LSKLILEQPEKRVLLMGNEAIARGAIEAGLQMMAAYPGTPSSEICEALIDVASHHDYYVEWSTNEKVAFEVASGASLVGARAMTAMKNAGLNVAMDTFITLQYGGVKGGMVVVVADDPDAHYSSTEQDTRMAAVYAEMPCLEPMDQQEAKDMTKAAFDMSEELELPIFLRSVSRISHASGDVRLGSVLTHRNQLGFNKHYKLPYRWNVYGGEGAVSKHKWLHSVLPKAKDISNSSPFNRLDLVEGSSTGVISSGIGTSYAQEAMDRLGLSGKLSHLKLGMIYPVPDELVSQLLQGISTLIVIEEGDPVVENLVRNLVVEIAPHVKIYGKGYNQILEPYGEINTDKVSEAVAGVLNVDCEPDQQEQLREQTRELIVPRSSTFCAGCSHLGSYHAIQMALRKYKDSIHITNGDIGCYEQGGYGLSSSNIKANDEESKRYPLRSPYEVLDTIYVMGSGIGMAQGQAQVGYQNGKVLAVAGDSTVLHGTLPAVVNAVYSNADITFVVFDNRWTAMTGHQPNPCTGINSLGESVKTFNIQEALSALGVEYVKRSSAYNPKESIEALEEALEFAGPSVVILEGECQLQVQRRTKTPPKTQTWVDQERCTGCKICVQLGCPAITFDTENKKAGIDDINCTDCELCMQICPEEAIKMGGEL